MYVCQKPRKGKARRPVYRGLKAQFSEDGLTVDFTCTQCDWLENWWAEDARDGKVYHQCTKARETFTWDLTK